MRQSKKCWKLKPTLQQLKYLQRVKPLQGGVDIITRVTEEDETIFSGTIQIAEIIVNLIIIRTTMADTPGTGDKEETEEEIFEEEISLNESTSIPIMECMFPKGQYPTKGFQIIKLPSNKHHRFHRLHKHNIFKYNHTL